MSDWASVRGDAAKLHTDPLNVIFRPTSVSAGFHLLRVGALVNLVWGLVIIVSVIAADNPFTRHVTGPFAISSDKYWFWHGLLVIFIGYLGFRCAAGFYRGDSAARFPALSVAILNIVLGLAAFPWGMFQAVVGLLLLLAVTSIGTEQWITRDVTQTG